VLTLDDVHGYYGESHVIQGVSLGVERGETVALVGRNGAGKTTLLKVLADALAPDLGEVVLGTHVSVGYYAQEHEGIVPGRSLLEHMREASPAGDGALRNLLGMFGLSGQKVFQDQSSTRKTPCHSLPFGSNRIRVAAKQSGAPHVHAQKAQNHVPTAQSESVLAGFCYNHS